MATAVNNDERLRLFVALLLPGTVVERLGRQANEWRTMGARGRWVRPENMHLTLRFIGAFPQSRLDALDAQLRHALEGFPMLEMRIKGMGVFPSARRPAVLWAGFSVLSGTLQEMQVAVENSLQALGLPPEDKAFSPHVTLARFRGPQESRQAASVARQLLTAADSCVGAPFTVRRVHLAQSTLTPSGPLYQNLREYSLS